MQVGFETPLSTVKSLGFTCVWVSSGFLLNLMHLFSIDVLLDTRSTQPTRLMAEC